MKFVKLSQFAIFFFALLAVGFEGANAVPPDKPDVNCGAITMEFDLQNLCLVTESADSLKERVQNALAGKVFSANEKLMKVKCEDAVQKLTDYQNTVMALDMAPKEKISEADANCLLDGVPPMPMVCPTIGVTAIIMNLEPTCP